MTNKKRFTAIFLTFALILSSFFIAEFNTILAESTPLFTYNPASTNAHDKTYLIEDTDAGTLEYDPKNNPSTNGWWDAVYGPWSGKPTLTADNYYRVEVEIALTGNDSATVTNDSVIFGFMVSKTAPASNYPVTVSDIKNIGSDGFGIFTYYCKATETGTGFENYIRPNYSGTNFGTVGFKVRDISYYNATETEYTEFYEDAIFTYNPASTNAHDKTYLIEDTDAGTLEYNPKNNPSTNGWWDAVYGPWSGKPTLTANNYYRVDVEVALTGNDSAEITGDSVIFGFMVSKSNPASNYAVKVSDIRNTGNDGFGTFAYYFQATETGTGFENYIRPNYSGTNFGTVGFKIRDISYFNATAEQYNTYYNVVEPDVPDEPDEPDEPDVPTQTPLHTYNPASFSTRYSSDYLTVVTDNGVQAIVYNPVTNAYSSINNKRSMWGPYNNNLAAGYYRLDIEVALTGNDSDTKTDSSILFNIDMSGTDNRDITVGDLPQQAGSDGYYIYSHYFKLENAAGYTEYPLILNSKIGMKIRNLNTYSATEEEYKAYLGVEDEVPLNSYYPAIANTYDRTLLIKDEANKTVEYDPVNAPSGDSNYNAVYGPWSNKPQLTGDSCYKVVVEVALTEKNTIPATKDSLIFGFAVSNTAPSSNYPVTVSDIKNIGRDGFGTFTYYVKASADTSSYENYIRPNYGTETGTVGFKIRKISYYSATNDEYNAFHGNTVDLPTAVWSSAAANMSSNVGFKNDGSILLAPGMGSGTAFYGPYKEYSAGSYKAVIIMKLQQERDSNDDELGVFDVCYTVDERRYERKFQTTITTGMLEKDNLYCAVEIPVTFETDVEVVEFRYQYNNKYPLKIQQILLIKAEDSYPFEGIKQDDVVVRPDNIIPTESYDVSLSRENVILEKASNATFTGDGSLGFVLENNTPGGIKKLANKIYVTSGIKTVRIYLRTTDDVAGKFEFFKIGITQGGKITAYAALTADDLKGKANTCIAYDYQITADKDEPIDIIASWAGNCTVYIDKIVVKTDSEADGKEKVLEMTETSNGHKITINRSELNGLSIIDNIRMSTSDGYDIVLSAAALDVWFGSENSIDIILTDADSSIAGQLRTMAGSIGYSVKDKAVFSISATAGGKKINALPSALSIETTVDSENNKEKLDSIGFFYNGSKYSLAQSSFDSVNGVIKGNLSDFGTFYLGMIKK